MYVVSIAMSAVSLVGCSQTLSSMLIGHPSWVNSSCLVFAPKDLCFLIGCLDVSSGLVSESCYVVGDSCRCNHVCVCVYVCASLSFPDVLFLKR